MMAYRVVGAIASAALLVGVASAQTMAPQAADHSPANAVVKSGTVAATDAPASGANSFTEAQARTRFGKAGFADVSDLTKDDKGLWQGTATKHGKKVNVALDYKGNVSSK
jgi:hypothetical protein